MSLYGAGCQHTERAHHEQEAFEVPYDEEIAYPLYDFAEVVGSTNVLKQKPPDNDVFGLLSFLPSNLELGRLHHPVRLDINPHTEHKHGHSQHLHEHIAIPSPHGSHALQVPVGESERKR